MATSASAFAQTVARAESSGQAPDAAKATATPAAPPNTLLHPSRNKPLVGGRIGAKVRAFIQSDEEKSRIFKRAEATFPAFCKDWERKLRDRERFHLDNLKWTLSDGGQSATYLGYSDITRCTCKKSAKGIPVGLLSYQEIIYKLAGKTSDEALHSAHQQTSVTNTTEIFGFDKDHWAY